MDDAIQQSRARVLPQGFRLVLPWPPSVNTYWRHPSRGPLAGRHLISTKGRDYRIAVQASWARTGRRSFGDARLSVMILAHVPDRRRRDLDNIPKAVLDALTHAGLWCDDSQIDELSIRRATQVQGGRLVVCVDWLGAGA